MSCDRPRDGQRVPVVDLLAQFGNADHRPASARFEMTEHTFGGRSRASLVVPAESRIVWTLLVPRRARLVLWAGVPDVNGAASAAFRVGASDGRVYVTVTEQTVSSDETMRQGWVPVTADLSPFAGRKLSIFYRPDRIRWQVIIGTHILSGSPGIVYLGEPVIDTDRDGVREYMKRRTTRAQ